jgi:hypothetical protein
VWAAALANGGSFGNIEPGIKYFASCTRSATSCRWSAGRPPCRTAARRS